MSETHEKYNDKNVASRYSNIFPDREHIHGCTKYYVFSRMCYLLDKT